LNNIHIQSINYVQEDFAAFRDEAANLGQEFTDEELWYEFVGGHNNKYRVHGVGDYEREMRALRSPSSQSSSKSKNSQKRRMSTSDVSEIAALRDENKILKEQMEAVLASQKTILEEIAMIRKGSPRPPPGSDDDGMEGGHGFGVV